MALALVSARYPQPSRIIRTSGLGRIELLADLKIIGPQIFVDECESQLYFGAELFGAGFFSPTSLASAAIFSSIRRLASSILRRPISPPACIASFIMAGVSWMNLWPV